ncbi:MAG: M23 family metallopeptidase [Oscillospiraceae bacterium]|nr:M23 family metallopeptidase [Oscillospiraceae bacterium]
MTICAFCGKISIINCAAEGERLIRTGDINKNIYKIFAPPIRALKRIPRRGLLSHAAFAAALIVAVFAVSTRRAATCALYYNGAPVAVAASEADAEEAVAAAELLLAELLGGETPLSGAITYRLLPSAVPDSAETVENAIIAAVPGVSESFVIEADGVILGAAESEANANAVISRALADMLGENTVAAEFVSDVTVSRRFVSDAAPRDADEIAELLRTYAAAERTVRRVTTVELPYGSLYVEDFSMYEGTSAVVSEGRNGVREVAALATYRDGAEVGYVIESDVTLSEPEDELVRVGIAAPGTSLGHYILPVPDDCIMTSGFGRRSIAVGSENHKGIDLTGPVGTEIYASDGGLVVFAGMNEFGFGNLVIIQHDNGDLTYYAHCLSVSTEVGARVSQGAVIAAMGRSGSASGVHLHFELRPRGGAPVNPMKYLEGKK